MMLSRVISLALSLAATVAVVLSQCRIATKDDTIQRTTSTTRNKKTNGNKKLRGRRWTPTDSANASMLLDSAHPTNNSIPIVLEPKHLRKSKKIMCGGNKCFFPFQSNPEMGLVVTPAQRLSHKNMTTPQDWWRILQASWELAEQMAREYHIEHFALEAPRRITISHELATRMNRNLWRESKSVFLTENRFVQGSEAYIQGARAASQPNLLLGCGKTKIRGFWRDVDAFLNSFAPSKKDFARQFVEDVQKAKAMMRGEPCLIQDFQVMLDTTGRLNHLDFDRCFTPEDPGTKRVVLKGYKEKCYAHLDDMEKHILKALAK